MSDNVLPAPTTAVKPLAAWRQYKAVTKPRVIQLIVFCALIGMVLAVPGVPGMDDVITAAIASLGIWLVSGAAAAFNCIVEKSIDAKMKRTSWRPTARGDLSDTQTLLFSATFPDAVRALSKSYQRDPLEILLDTDTRSEHIAQGFFEVPAYRKNDALLQLLGQLQPAQALVFCNTKIDCQNVEQHLAKAGFDVCALHGDLEQRDRDEAMVRFQNGSVRVLVATDVAARGLDVSDLPLVFSYELAHQADVHVHRVGRTGRAGKDGQALALVAPGEMARVKAIEEQMGMTARWQRLDLSSIKLAPLKAEWKTVVIDAGRKDKLRPGDILGALTAKQMIDGKSVGKIALFDTRSYVALHKSVADKALQLLRQDKIKGRSFRVRLLSP